MTINVDGKVAAPEGVALEVIEAFAGIEQSRRRLVHGDDARLVVHGSVTLILREVQTADDLQPKPGEQRHGELAGPGAVAQLEEGDLDPVMTEAEETMLDAQERVLVVVGQFVTCDDPTTQLQLFQELQLAHRAYADAAAVVEAQHMDDVA